MINYSAKEVKSSERYIGYSAIDVFVNIQDRAFPHVMPVYFKDTKDLDNLINLLITQRVKFV